MDDGKVRAIANASFSAAHQGEILRVDPDLWASYFEAGWLSELDDQGERVAGAADVPDLTE